ncbi:MAG TPA: type II toxin-antitoxin system VapC family toxin [Thermomicrobiales bacterium]|nr:type II toxin-antitoxin system VapC family toxin [Thermomicrobiales bacterium]
MVVLDTGPLGLLTFPQSEPEAVRRDRWLQSILDRGIAVAIPEIADFELRRELVRMRRTTAVRRLDDLARADGIVFVPIRSDAMRLAAAYWATARQQGRPTADPHALDGDVILAAQARMLGYLDEDFVVATVNIRHLNQFVPAAEWWTVTGS